MNSLNIKQSGTASVYNIEDYRDDNNKHGDGGGSNMDKYATKQELKNLEAKIDSQFDNLNTKLDGHFKLVDEKFNSTNIKITDAHNSQDDKFKNIDDRFVSLPEQIKNIVHESEDKQRKEINDNRKFIWGTIVIGGIATVASVISVILTIMFH